MSAPRRQTPINQALRQMRQIARDKGAEIHEALGIQPDVTDAPEVERRRPGRPRRTAEGFHREYKRARNHCGAEAPDKALAAEIGVSEEWFSELVRRFGRPT